MTDYSGGQFLRLPMWLTDKVFIPEGLLPSGAKSCLLLIARKTIGYGKKSDAIAVSQFKKLTRLCNQTILDSCEYLANKGFIQRKRGPRNTWIYSLAEREKILQLMDSLIEEKQGKPKRKIPRKSKSTVLTNRTMTVLADRTVTILANRTETDKKETEMQEANQSTVLTNRTMTVLADRNTIDINRYIYINIYRSLVRHFKVGEVGYFDGINPIEESKTEDEKSVTVKPKKPKRKIFYEERDFKCAEWMLNKVNEVLNAIGWKSTTANLDKWANTIRLMRTQDKHSYEEIFEMFKWANRDEFWRINIKSPDKLRAKWDDLGIRRQLEKQNLQRKQTILSNNQSLNDAMFISPEKNMLIPTLEQLANDEINNELLTYEAQEGFYETN